MKKANALIEASGLRMLAVEDFDKAAQTVSITLTYQYFVDFATPFSIMHKAIGTQYSSLNYTPSHKCTDEARSKNSPRFLLYI